jgi:stress-induced morphogen
MEFLEIKNLIKAGITDATVNIYDMTGTKDHLDIVVISDQFAGKMLFQQHRMIMDILSERLKTDIHAVQLKTYTYQTAKDKGVL